MSKRGFIYRYFAILKKLKQKPYSSYDELHQYLDSRLEFLKFEDDTLDIAFSKRTFQRDIREIRSLFGIEIEYSKNQKGYFINQSADKSTQFQNMIEEFDLYNLLNITDDITQYIQLEKRKPQGTEDFYGLIHAIKNKLLIRFKYQAYWEPEKEKRTVEPYALKQFRNRLYIIAREGNDTFIKSFALDRLSEFEILDRKFEYALPFDVNEYYRYCFGITGPNGKPPHKIVLSFIPFQGNYIKTLPLHDTQKVLIDNDEELRVELLLCITNDLIMEILSYGERVKVIDPPELVQQIRDTHQKALKQY